jgi:YVTN family beta-propeller protein
VHKILAVLGILFAATALAAQHYQMEKPIRLGGEGFWDYLTADTPNRRLYVSHGTEVEVVDLDSRAPVGKITGLNGVHGIAVADDLGKGFISSGRGNSVAVFNLKDLQTVATVKTGVNPDGIVYEPVHRLVLTFNGRSNDATVINAATAAVTGTIALGGRPEFPVADGKGDVYANIEDKSEIVRLDPVALKVKARWSILPCEGPSGLAMDTARRRLFSVCDKKMAVVDADSGRMVATLPIGDGPDAAFYEPSARLAFASNGDGTLTVVKQESADRYVVAQTVQTQRGARTMALDTKTGVVYLPDADFGAPPKATAENPRPRPSIVPGSFRVLVVSPVPLR